MEIPQSDAERSALDIAFTFKRPRHHFFLALGFDLEQRLGSWTDFHPEREFVVKVVLLPAVTDRVFWINLNQPLFIDVDNGKLEV